MYFKHLELSGFKSFSDKTVLNFEPGTTAIVGPNGCGKSNISDAIQWVLGEQSAKTLRGSKMEDIIFDGTAERKPVGLAEVSLTLGDADAAIGLGYSEIKLTRRLFRSGESEYLINNNICRLRDINELIMGTGLGLSTYSVMGQGRMDEILKSKPEERRYLFEEAAGITKYKNKKNEALRKLEYTESNLLRLGDIINEVKRQINSVKRQATKAQKYKDIDDELRDLEVKITSYKYAEMKNAFAGLKKKSLDYDENEKRLHEETASLEKEINKDRIELDAILSKISDIRENKFELSKKNENLKTKLIYNKERIEEIKKGFDLKRSELSDLERKVDEIGEKDENVREDLSRLASQIEDVDVKVNSASNDLTKINAEIAKKILDIKQGKEKSIELLSLNTKCGNELVVADQRERDIVLREKRLRVESDELDLKVDNINRDIKVKTADLQRQQQHTKKIKKEIQEVESELASKQERISSIEHDRISLQKQKAEKNSKLEVLLDLKKKYEGFYEGVKDILRASRDSGLLDGIIGPVSEIIQVENGFELAFEVALGSNAQVLVSGSIEEGTRALEHIKKNSKGRATFVAIDNPKVIDRFNVSVLQSEDGFLGHILDFVKYEQRYNDVINYLLGDVVVFRDIETALAASRKHDFPCDIATKSGEYISSRCLISGGENESALQGVVARESQILRLQDEIKNIDEKSNDLDSSYKQIDSETALLLEHSKDINSELYKNEINLANMNFEVARLQSLVTQYNSDKERLRSEINFLSEEKSGILEKRNELKLSLEKTSSESDAIKKTMDDYD
ncbi:MAG: chromosome segregation protein SMC, partial [bacterium]|nr:chromosome segregation protein SMC [bacterium]